jgi:hypothetical protein
MVAVCRRDDCRRRRADVLIRRVYLQRGRLVGKLVKGPEEMPYELGAGDGTATWIFDDANPSQQLSDLVGKEPTALSQ